MTCGARDSITIKPSILRTSKAFCATGRYIALIQTTLMIRGTANHGSATTHRSYMPTGSQNNCKPNWRDAGFIV